MKASPVLQKRGHSEVFNSTRPMHLWQSALFAMVPAAFVYIAHWVLAPAINSKLDQPYLVTYLICWGATEFVFFIASLAAYRLEGNPPTWAAFVGRYRLQRPGWRGVMWGLVALAGMLTTYLALAFTAHWLASIKAFSPHPSFPPELTPNGTSQLVAGEFMGMSLQGAWWVLIAYLAGWIFNILGEEMWYRGLMLPRQEARHGSIGWLVNGLSFLTLHVVWKWNLIAMLPGSLILSYIAQRQKSTWIGIFAHGILNFSPIIAITAGVFGWGPA